MNKYAIHGIFRRTRRAQFPAINPHSPFNPMLSVLPYAVSSFPLAALHHYIDYILKWFFQIQNLCLPPRAPLVVMR